MQERKLAKPTIHLNGTSAEELVRQYCEAAGGIRAALDAVQINGPNARDYYPQGHAGWALAQEQHIERCQKLRDMLKEFEELAEHASSEER